MKFIKNDLWRYSPPSEETIICQPSCKEAGRYHYFRPIGYHPYASKTEGHFVTPDGLAILIPLPFSVGLAFERLLTGKKYCCGRFVNKTFRLYETLSFDGTIPTRTIFYNFCPECGERLEHG